ncbi:FxsA family protein [Roseobacter sp. OBYS 0001]|uniref:FxsA family protein n=1 Tax=Roseobacter sp. OBYS 0001 TaxID=882651 RepID=UPI001BC08C5C|nr:FxsA family protein [Roseobacter sp. OBYS 0001]GIT86301.1 exclusion protein FxsA [Roseobacter sp. OBYS 0001]
MWLFIAFLAIPLLEIALFIQIGGAIGLGWTLATVVVSAVLGTFLVRNQGALALGQVKSSFNQMQDPTEPLAHGAMILFSGALLLTPGFFTDTIGFLLLIPGVRASAFRAIKARMNITTFEAANRSHGPKHPGRGQPDNVIDGDYTEVKPEADQNKRPSGWTDH